MKRITIVCIVASLLLLSAFVVVRAEMRGRPGWAARRWHRFGPAGYVAHELNLTRGQRAQIQTLWQAERPNVSAQAHDLFAENKEMDALISSGDTDQTKVQQVADREAKTIANLLVEKERLQSRIYTTVLNPEQRAKADELQKKMQSHLDQFADRLAAPQADR